MVQTSGWKIWPLAAVGFAAYFAAAVYLNRTFVDPVPRGSLVLRLKPPFERSGNAAVSGANVLPLALFADDDHINHDTHSLLVVYEGPVPLGPAHNSFQDIAKLGMGRFSHWATAIVFSASDNSDPNTNGRHYWAVLP